MGGTGAVSVLAPGCGARPPPAAERGCLKEAVQNTWAMGQARWAQGLGSGHLERQRLWLTLWLPSQGKLRPREGQRPREAGDKLKVTQQAGGEGGVSSSGCPARREGGT